jgi:hypothetical protein
MTIEGRKGGTSITEFHYNGVTVELDPQWASEWYIAKLDEQLDLARSGGSKWGWFWVNQRAGVTFTYRLVDSASYAFTVRDYANLAHDDQIIDLKVAN